MDKVKEITSGKAKTMYTTSSDDLLIMEFRDDASAFDGKKRASLAGKGSINNQFNAFIMNFLTENGIKNHYIESLDSTHSLVNSLDMFPIECVIRNIATGSICRRLGTEDGLKLKTPLFEFFLKDDELGDPLINKNHIISFNWAEENQINEMIKITHRVNELLRELFTNAGMILVDFKLEFGLMGKEILLGDEFTPEKLDKDRFRQDLGDVVESYHLVADRLGIDIKVD